MKPWMIQFGLVLDLQRHSWFRRLCGGCWEMWWQDLLYKERWFRVQSFSAHTGRKPNALCCGTPVLEDYRAYPKGKKP